MKKNNKRLIFSLVFISLIVFVFIFLVFRPSKNSVNTQMRLLKGGNLEQRIAATSFMRRNQINEAFPYIIENINFKENLGARGASSTLACFSVQALEEMAKYKASDINICQDWIFNDDHLVSNIQKNWQNWYANQVYSGWQVYQNKDLGFEISYPKEVFDWSCDLEFKDGEYYSGDAMIPLKIFEDGDIIYIDKEYSYYGKKESCEKKYKSIEDVKKNFTWGIEILDIPTDDSLDKFIKNNFGTGCYIAERSGLDQEGTFMIHVAGDDGVGLDTDCPINYAFVLNYFPEQNRAAYWELGQEASFWGDQHGNNIYDQEMVDSFRFLEE